MAVLAAQTRLQRSERQLALTHAARAVTVEARRNFLVRRQPPHGFRQVVRPYLLVSHGDPQRRRLGRRHRRIRCRGKPRLPRLLAPTRHQFSGGWLSPALARARTSTPPSAFCALTPWLWAPAAISIDIRRSWRASSRRPAREYALAKAMWYSSGAGSSRSAASSRAIAGRRSPIPIRTSPYAYSASASAGRSAAAFFANGNAPDRSVACTSSNASTAPASALAGFSPNSRRNSAIASSGRV